MSWVSQNIINNEQEVWRQFIVLLTESDITMNDTPSSHRMSVGQNIFFQFLTSETGLEFWSDRRINKYLRNIQKFEQDLMLQKSFYWVVKECLHCCLENIVLRHCVCIGWQEVCKYQFELWLTVCWVLSNISCIIEERGSHALANLTILMAASTHSPWSSRQHLNIPRSMVKRTFHSNIYMGIWTCSPTKSMKVSLS